MNKSETISLLAKALAKAQSELKNTPASKDNPHFKSKYTPLDDLLEMARSVLPNHGLSIIQSVSGAVDTVSVVTLILHESGEWIESDPLTMKADKNTPQGQGSAITYGRRYSLSAALGIATDPDDDGQGAEKKQEPKQAAKTSESKDAVITEKQRLELVGKVKSVEDKARLEEIINRLGYKSTKEIKPEHYAEICQQYAEYNLPEVLQ